MILDEIAVGRSPVFASRSQIYINTLIYQEVSLYLALWLAMKLIKLAVLRSWDSSFYLNIRWENQPEGRRTAKTQWKFLNEVTNESFIRCYEIKRNMDESSPCWSVPIDMQSELQNTALKSHKQSNLLVQRCFSGMSTQPQGSDIYLWLPQKANSSSSFLLWRAAHRQAPESLDKTFWRWIYPCYVPCQMVCRKMQYTAWW